MKRNVVNLIVKFILFFVLIFMSSLSLLSCNGSKNKSVLWYQEDIGAVRCTLETSKGDYNRFVFDLNFGTADKAIIQEPEEFSGVIFTRDGESAKISIGNTYVELSDGFFGDIDIVFGAFKIKEDDISSIGKNDNGDTYFEALVEKGVYTVVLDDNGIPHEISFDGTTSLKITNITVYNDKEDDESNPNGSSSQCETFARAEVNFHKFRKNTFEKG